MFLDAREIPNRTVLKTDICIIGAGAAGITLVRELSCLGKDIVLLEGGGLKTDRASQSLYDGEVVGAPYELETSRSRFFGGSTNCWGGFCAPIEAGLFEKRDWIPHSGWPVSSAEVMSYYPQACETAGIQYKRGFDVEEWNLKLGNPKLNALPIQSEKLVTAVAQVARQKRRFGKYYRNELRSLRNVRVLLNANVGLIDADSSGCTVKRVKVIPEAGKEISISSRIFVLAAGGIENARLLLLSDNIHTRGLGNNCDVVGRYFAEHVSVAAGHLKLLDSARSTRIYDTAYAFNKLHTSFFLRLTKEVQQRERLAYAGCSIDNWAEGEESNSVESLKHCYLALRTGAIPDQLIKHMFIMARSAPGMAKFVCWYLFGWDMMIARRELNIQLEQCPNPESRVMLSSECDSLGLRKVRLDWRLTDLDRHTIRRTAEIIAAETASSDIVRITPYESALNGEWMEKPNWLWHHMGTTRMGSHKLESVVDANLRVHELDNLYIAGSSVFPCAPVHAPTLTILALTHRLADHLKFELSRGNPYQLNTG